MKRMEQRCQKIHKGQLSHCSEWEVGKLWRLAAAVLPGWAEGVRLPGMYWGEDQLSLFGWSGKLAYRPWGDTVWIMLVSHRTKINKPYYNFLGLLYELVVWSRTPNRYGSFISHDLFPSDMHLQREMLFSSWSKLYKWGQQASHDALILHGLHYTWW